MKFVDEVRKINKKADRDFYKRNEVAIGCLKRRIMNAAGKGKYFIEAQLDMYENYDLEYIRKYFMIEGFKSFSYSELPYVKKYLLLFNGIEVDESQPFLCAHYIFVHN